MSEHNTSTVTHISVPFMLFHLLVHLSETRLFQAGLVLESRPPARSSPFPGQCPDMLVRVVNTPKDPFGDGQNSVRGNSLPPLPSQPRGLFTYVPPVLQVTQLEGGFSAYCFSVPTMLTAQIRPPEMLTKEKRVSANPNVVMRRFSFRNAIKDLLDSFIHLPHRPRNQELSL